MKYETLEDLKRAEAEIAEFDKMLDQESNFEVKGAISELSGGAVGAAGGVGGGLAAVYFMGTVGFSGAGIVSGLAAIGALVGGGMLAGIAVVATVPVILGGGGAAAVRYYRSKQFKEARKKLRAHAVARRDFLERLIKEKGDLGDLLEKYKLSLMRLSTMIEDLS